MAASMRKVKMPKRNNLLFTRLTSLIRINQRELRTTSIQAGGISGDRVWRMPLFKHYTSQIKHCDLADVNNIGKYSRSGGSCTAAAFLKEFVENKNWLHLDIAGVMINKDEVSYLPKGMSGRPTRTIVEFLSLLSKQQL